MNFNDLYFYEGSPALAAQTGPKTPAGKAIAARNATSHGLFARDVVLTYLGEDPEAFEALREELCRQIQPQNLIEQHYVEQIAAASWRLRRLDRWQAQIYEDANITEDARFDKLDQLIRHETTLRRQIDKAVRLLGRTGTAVGPVMPESFDMGTLDTRCENPAEAEQQEENKKCENEMAPRNEPLPPTEDGFFVHPDGRPCYLHPMEWEQVRTLRAQGDRKAARKLLEERRRHHIDRLTHEMQYLRGSEEMFGPDYNDSDDSEIGDGISVAG